MNLQEIIFFYKLAAKKCRSKVRADILTSRMSKIDWDEINRKIPYEQTDEAKAKRRKLFSDFDPNGNGYLSLAEVRTIR